MAASLTQLERALGRVPDVTPVAVSIFGGVVDPARLRFPFNRMPPTDARDWDAITAWADEIVGHVAPDAVAEQRTAPPGPSATDAARRLSG